MGISSAVEWWEEWQLRVLVLSSLVIQWLLFIFAIRRKHVISYWGMRFFIWLAYLGSDAIAIYALAALFNRQRKQNYAATNNKSILELLWAPILLMHLGGQDCITAYNIEDNELWRRHVLTAVSQITVAIYVFCKSWPSSGHKRLLQVSILAFVPGVLKCLEKPWALKKASINSLVSPSDHVPRTEVSRMGDIDPLQEYVKDIVDAYGGGLFELAQAVEDPWEDPFPARLPLGIRRPSHLFADLASPYSDRIVTLRSFWMLDKRQAFASLQIGIHGTFDLLYTKIKMTTNLFKLRKTREEQGLSLLQLIFIEMRFLVYALPLIANLQLLLASSFLKAYDKNDAMVTIVLFWCTGALEYASFYAKMYDLFKKNCGSRREYASPFSKMYDHFKKKLCGSRRLPDMKISPVMVAQYSLVGFFARNQRHNTMMCIVSSFGCKDLVDQLWCMKPCRSSAQIIELVVEHVKKGWKEEIYDAASYRKFNDRRGQWTLGANNHQHLGWSLRRPLDESVLLWHIATDICFYAPLLHQDAASAPHHARATWCETSPHRETAVRCREISQYMMYLLFVNPEMLLAGTRRNLFTAATAQLEEILNGQNMSPNEMEIIDKLKSQQGSLSQERGGFFHDAMALADALRSVDDEKKMWEVIEGVWVEMLCFSASRCRGYLHAKSLGAGGEFLTYVWLLLSHMGMETLPEKLQGVEMEGNTGAAPLFSGSVRTLRRTLSVRQSEDAYGDHFFIAFQSILAVSYLLISCKDLS